MDKYLDVITARAEELELDIIDMQYISKDLLEVSIARKDYLPVDLDMCTRAAESFGEAIDFEIALDVGSAGAERIIDIDNYDDLDGQYVHIKFTNPVQGADYVEGTIVAISEDYITVSYRQKAALKKIELERSNISMLRLAVKI